jgi:two-component system sensor histidine kinase NreB
MNLDWVSDLSGRFHLRKRQYFATFEALRALKIGFAVLDRDGRILRCDQVVADLAGKRAREDLIGEILSEQIPEMAESASLFHSDEGDVDCTLSVVRQGENGARVQYTIETHLSQELSANTLVKITEIQLADPADCSDPTVVSPTRQKVENALENAPEEITLGQYIGESMHQVIKFQRVILSAVSEGILILNQKYQIEQANHQAENLFDAEPGGLIGQRFWSFLSPVEHDLDQERYPDLVSDPGPSAALKLPFVSVRGREFYAEVVIKPMVLSGGVKQVIVVQDVDEQMKRFQEIANLRQDFEALSARILVGLEEERRRISLDLHDDIGQRLTGLGISIGQLIDSKGNQPDEKREGIYQQFQEAIQAVRTLSLGLSPVVLDYAGLVDALEELGAAMAAQSGFAVIFDFMGISRGVRLDSDIEITAYRIVQEALNNALKYGEVHEANVSLVLSDDVLAVSIKDQGVGFEMDMKRPGRIPTGILGMKERVSQIGGEFEVVSALNDGTTIIARLPIGKEDEESDNQSKGEFPNEEDIDRR